MPPGDAGANFSDSRDKLYNPGVEFYNVGLNLYHAGAKLYDTEDYLYEMGENHWHCAFGFPHFLLIAVQTVMDAGTVLTMGRTCAVISALFPSPPTLA